MTSCGSAREKITRQIGPSVARSTMNEPRVAAAGSVRSGGHDKWKLVASHRQTGIRVSVCVSERHLSVVVATMLMAMVMTTMMMKVAGARQVNYRQRAAWTPLSQLLVLVVSVWLDNFQGCQICTLTAWCNQSSTLRSLRTTNRRHLTAGAVVKLACATLIAH
jgi:hypothetical protein